VFYNSRSFDPLLQAGVSLALGSVAAALASLLDLTSFGFGFIGWLVAFWAGSAAGAAIADLSYRIAGRRRGRYSWLVVAASIVFGGLMASAVVFLFTGVFISLSRLIFIGMAAIAAVGRLRLGR
jgi:asparagine N-glycosylation enzyme membrane subunit Stt3